MKGPPPFRRDAQRPQVPWKPRLPDGRSEHLRGIVDMGSNGIRFSVSDLSPSTARIMPTLYVNRVDISLYDAQFDDDTGEQVPIPKSVMSSVVAALLRFQHICEDFGVSQDNIQIIATEATRKAVNSKEFLKTIKQQTGLDVELLSKVNEGRIGALGIASGFSDIQGLAMDLGGGSMQITWLIFRGGNVRLPPQGAVSFPYGAAALTRKLAELRKDKSKEEGDRAVEQFRQEMTVKFREAFYSMNIPDELVERAEKEGGFPLYLSGGGFRGWGYLLLYLSQVHGHHYPISIINGFSAYRSDFQDTEKLKEVAKTAHKIFRVSDRRRMQVPAVAFLVKVLAEAIPHGIKEANFCQGGVRQGVLFQELPPSIRAQDPLEVATAIFTPPSGDAIYSLLMTSIPKPSVTGERKFPESISSHVIRSFTNVLYVHSTMSKESSSMSALYSTSTGLMSSTHGVTHADRARIALMLEERYEGDLPPREVDFKMSLRHILTPEEVWWTGYLGRVGLIISRLYPAGSIEETKPRLLLSAKWSSTLGKEKNKQGVELTFVIQKVQQDPMKFKEALEDHISDLKKVGKKKNWIGGREGWGMAVGIKIVEEDIL
ncbi:Ppx/GppA phosphatase family-domain-containing protein [Xylogone sp. PMI_703]|nr:Ppx/GppA phosphatase family-domain-containing protein [Xylogone sp. PMI_703]